MEKNKKEVVIVNKTNYKVTIIVAIIVALFVYIITSTSYNEKQTKKDIEDYAIRINASEYVEIIKEANINVFYLGAPSCPFCIEFQPILSEVIEEYELTVYYINVDQEDSIGRTQIFETIEKFTEGLSTPTTIITKNDEVLYFKRGKMEKENLIQFLIDSEVISE